MNLFSWDRFYGLPIIGILRGFRRDQLKPVIETVCAGGLTNVEITMNSAQAADQIRKATELSAGALNVGAGTVLDLEVLTLAREAGASFVVTPTVCPTVIAECRRLALPIFPGAFTPTEIVEAWELGAAMVKVFPASGAGLGYIKSLKAPLPQIKLLPTGGVDLETLPAYRQAGADGFGIGAPLFDRDRINAGDWAWLENRCRAFRRALFDQRV